MCIVWPIVHRSESCAWTAPRLFLCLYWQCSKRLSKVQKYLSPPNAGYPSRYLGFLRSTLCEPDILMYAVEKALEKARQADLIAPAEAIGVGGNPGHS